MNKKLKRNFSYPMMLIRSCQGLLLIGIIVESLKARLTLNWVIYAVLLIISIISKKRLLNKIDHYIQLHIKEVTTLKDTLFSNIQIPLVVMSEDKIKWYNPLYEKWMEEINAVDKPLKAVFPDLKIEEWIKKEQPKQKKLKNNDRYYEVNMEIFHRLDQVKQYAFYFMDITEQEILKMQLDDEKTIIGYICVDNIDEISHSIEEVRRPMLLAIIDRKINLWFKRQETVIAKIDKDQYIVILSIRELNKMEESKFEILDEVRKIQVGNDLPVTISIGIGNNLNSLQNSKEDARIAFDLAQGRGGDQAVIKYDDKYTFYGGKTKEVEKSTRVKARIKAYAFKELLNEADKVLIMGHKNIDMDCLGAAMGVYRGASVFGKKAQIILPGSNFSISGLYDRIVNSNAYEDLFILPEDAKKEITSETLLVLVDTHRRSYVEVPELLEKAEKIVIFDHHRKSTDYIEEAVLTYLEPFISSTCEMIAEILKYLTEKIKLNPIEADALLAGITMDTKNFAVKAGVRTFEAAAFLKRSGADSIRVQMFFQDDMLTYRAKAHAIQMTEIWENNMAVSVVLDKLEYVNIVAAQVADSLLNIKDIQAAFVLSEMNNCIYISARALEGTNVQRIMELLGGGGHLGIAGAQLKGLTIDEAKQTLRGAIALYLKEGDSK